MKVNKKIVGFIATGVIILGMVGCLAPDVDNSNDVADVPKIEQPVIKPEVNKTPTVTVEKDLDLAGAAAYVEGIAKDYFEYVKVDYNKENKAIIMSVSTTGLARDYILSDSATIDNFENVVVENNILIKQTLETQLGSKEFSFISMVLNDQNKDNVLLSVVNGEILYSYSDEVK